MSDKDNAVEAGRGMRRIYESAVTSWNESETKQLLEDAVQVKWSEIYTDGFTAGYNAGLEASKWVPVDDAADVESGRYLATVGLSGMRHTTTCEINRSFGNWYLPNVTQIFTGIVYAIKPLPAPYTGETE